MNTPDPCGRYESAIRSFALRAAWWDRVPGGRGRNAALHTDTSAWIRGVFFRWKEGATGPSFFSLADSSCSTIFRGWRTPTAVISCDHSVKVRGASGERWSIRTV